MAQVYEKLKVRVRAYVEHPFHAGMNIFKLIRASLAMHREFKFEVQLFN